MKQLQHTKFSMGSKRFTLQVRERIVPMMEYLRISGIDSNEKIKQRPKLNR